MPLAQPLVWKISKTNILINLTEKKEENKDFIYSNVFTIQQNLSTFFWRSPIFQQQPIFNKLTLLYNISFVTGMKLSTVVTFKTWIQN